MPEGALGVLHSAVRGNSPGSLYILYIYIYTWLLDIENTRYTHLSCSQAHKASLARDQTKPVSRWGGSQSTSRQPPIPQRALPLAWGSDLFLHRTRFSRSGFHKGALEFSPLRLLHNHPQSAGFPGGGPEVSQRKVNQCKGK